MVLIFQLFADKLINSLKKNSQRFLAIRNQRNSKEVLHSHAAFLSTRSLDTTHHAQMIQPHFITEIFAKLNLELILMDMLLMLLTLSLLEENLRVNKPMLSWLHGTHSRLPRGLSRSEASTRMSLQISKRFAMLTRSTQFKVSFHIK